MTADRLISRYNHMSGNPVSVATLKDFHADIQQHLDANSHGPGVPELKEIHARVAKVIKKLIAGRYVGVDKVKILHQVKIKEAPAPVKVKPSAKRKPKLRSQVVESIDRELIYGLEKLPRQKIEGVTCLDGLGFTKAGQNKIYDMITGMILKWIQENEKFPWRAPWNIELQRQGIYATNFKTKTVYKGANLFLLNLIAPMFYGKKGPYWLTYKQAKDLGGHVKKGAEGFPVIYYSPYFVISKPVRKTISESQYKQMSDAEREAKGAIELLTVNYYTVFAQEDIEGVKFPSVAVKKTADPIETAEAIVKAMPQRPDITFHEEGRAYYNWTKDFIRMPAIGYFEKEQEYYSTLFHELVHSTGHKSRLDRWDSNLKTTDRDKDKQYAYEELIAEMGASYLNAEAGTLYFTLKNSANYIKGWQTRLEDAMKGDNKFFLKAAAKAAKASEFILGHQPGEGTIEVKETVSRKVKTKQVEELESELAGAKPAPAATGLKGLGFLSADQTPDKPVNTFTLPGVMGTLLGNMQRYKLQIVIAGETHSSKSQLGMQIADAFAAQGDDVAWIDWEQGGLISKDTQDSIARNVAPENKKRIHVSPDVPRTIEAVKELASHFKVIALDSGSKLNQVTNEWLDELREEYPDTVWIPLMQQNEKGGTRGGSSAEFNAPVVLKTYRPDNTTHEKNYAEVFKNRGNKTGILYSISKKSIIDTAPGEEIKAKAA